MDELFKLSPTEELYLRVGNYRYSQTPTGLYSFDSLMYCLEHNSKAVFGFTLETIQSRNRLGSIAEIRQFIFRILAIYTSATLNEIGDALKRDHATVLHAVKRTSALMAREPNYWVRYNRVLYYLLRRTSVEDADFINLKSETHKYKGGDGGIVGQVNSLLVNSRCVIYSKEVPEILKAFSFHTHLAHAINEGATMPMVYELLLAQKMTFSLISLSAAMDIYKYGN
jgi:hypothetical protein